MTRTTETSVELGPIDGPTNLTLSLADEATRERYGGEQLLLASVRSDDLQARVVVHGGYAGFEGLTEFFAGLAADWKGWDDRREWHSTESHMSIVATVDLTGHVRLRATLRPDPSRDDWITEVTIKLEAGSLDVVYAVVRDLIGSLAQ